MEPTSQQKFHLTCHICSGSILCPTDIEAGPGVPCEKKSQHLSRPAPDMEQYKSRSSSTYPLLSYADPTEIWRNKSAQRGRLGSSQKPGENKERFLPRHPHWFASFPPPPSLQQTNIAEEKLLCSHGCNAQAKKNKTLHS